MIKFLRNFSLLISISVLGYQAIAMNPPLDDFESSSNFLLLIKSKDLPLESRDLAVDRLMPHDQIRLMKHNIANDIIDIPLLINLVGRLDQETLSSEPRLLWHYFYKFSGQLNEDLLKQWLKKLDSKSLCYVLGDLWWLTVKSVFVELFIAQIDNKTLADMVSSQPNFLIRSMGLLNSNKVVNLISDKLGDSFDINFLKMEGPEEDNILYHYLKNFNPSSDLAVVQVWIKKMDLTHLIAASEEDSCLQKFKGLHEIVSLIIKRREELLLPGMRKKRASSPEKKTSLAVESREALAVNPIQTALSLLAELPIGGKLIEIARPEDNKIVLSLDSTATAAEVTKQIGLQRFLGLSVIRQASSIKIKFDNLRFIHTQLDKFRSFFPALKNVLSPVIKKPQGILNENAIPSYDWASPEDSPTIRTNFKSSKSNTARDSEKKALIKQSAQSKRKQNNSKHKKVQTTKKSEPSRVIPAKKAPAPPPAPTASGIDWDAPSTSLSGQTPKNLFPTISYESRLTIPKSVAKPQENTIRRQWLALAQYANGQIKDLLESDYDNKENLFFALYAPMVTLSDALCNFINQILTDENISNNPGFTKSDYIRFKQMRDEVIKMVSHNHSDLKLIDEFISLAREFNSGLLIAFPVMEKYLSNTSSTETFSINWLSIDAKIKYICSLFDIEVLNMDSHIENLNTLLLKFSKLTNEQSLEARGIIAMCGMILDPHVVLLRTGSPLLWLRKFRDSLAHPDPHLGPSGLEEYLELTIIKLLDDKQWFLKEVEQLAVVFKK